MNNFFAYIRYVRWRPWGTIAWTLALTGVPFLLALLWWPFWILFALLFVAPFGVELASLFFRSRKVAIFPAHRGPVTSLLITKSGAVISAGEDGFLRSFPSGKMVKAHAKETWLALEGETLYSASLDGKVKRWNSADLSRIDVAHDGEKGLTALAIGNEVMMAFDDGTLRGRPLGKTVRSIAIHPEGHIVAAGVEGGVFLLESADGEPRSLSTDLGAVRGVSFSPDGLHVAAGAGPLRIWSTHDGSVVADLPARAASHALYSPSGRWIVSETDAVGESLGLWNAETGELVREFNAAHPVTAIAISPDESRLAAGTRDGAILVWSL